MLLEREGFVSRPSWEELKGGAKSLPPPTASWGMATWLAVPRVFRFRTPLSGDRSGQIVRRRTGSFAHLWSHSWPRGQSSERGRLWPISISATISASFDFGHCLDVGFSRRLQSTLVDSERSMVSTQIDPDDDLPVTSGRLARRVTVTARMSVAPLPMP